MRRRLLLSGLTCLAAASAHAQAPPGPMEAQAYAGLHAAAWKGDTSTIGRLLGSGADPNARDANGRTPYLVAAFAGRRAAMRALVAGGSDPRALDRQRYDAVTIAAVADDLATLEVALELGGDPRAITSPYDGTALIAAAHVGNLFVVERLIKAGAPLDHINNLGWTALIEAVVLGDGGPRHTACVRLLLAAGARPDLADRAGVTPLQHARQRGFPEMVAQFVVTPPRR